MQLSQLKEDDVSSLYDFFVAHDFFSEPISKTQFEGQIRHYYLSSPLRLSYNLLARQKDGVVGSHLCIPLPFRVGNRALVAGLGSNLLLAEKSRSTVNFLNVQREYLRGYAPAGLQFVYGLVNRPGVLSLHCRTGYRALMRMPVRAVPINVAAFIAPRLPGRWLKSVAQWLAKPLNAFVLHLFTNLGPNSHLRVVETTSFAELTDIDIDAWLGSKTVFGQRDHATLDWRFSSHMKRGYRKFLVKDNNDVHGYMVVREMPLKHLKALVIVDLLFPETRLDAGAALVRQALRLAHRQHVDICATLLSPGSHVHRLFTRIFHFLNTPESFTLIANVPNGAEYEAAINHPENWFVSWFDHDVV